MGRFANQACGCIRGVDFHQHSVLGSNQRLLPHAPCAVRGKAESVNLKAEINMEKLLLSTALAGLFGAFWLNRQMFGRLSCLLNLVGWLVGWQEPLWCGSCL